LVAQASARYLLNTLSRMRLHISEEEIQIRLSPLEKTLGLLKSIRVERAYVSDVQVLEDPLHEVMRAGLKVGLRLPWLYYLCRSISLDRVWIVRRGVPAVSFAVRNQGVLEHVTVSTRDAREIAQRLES
jgi:hypothetical protein